MGHDARVSLTCAAVALVVSGVAVVAVLSAYDWRISVPVRMPASEPLAQVARASDPSFVFVNKDALQDGTWFYGIARDPLAVGREHTLVQDPAYRYGHGGYGLLASLVSAGQPAAVPAAMLGRALPG